MTSKESGGAVACKEISEKKQAANRWNAQKSTGSKTQAGKARSRWNAMKHGLLAKHAVVEEYENRKEFSNLLRVLRAEFQPSGVIEEILVERIADCYWNLGRIAALKRAHMTKWLKDNKQLDSFWLTALLKAASTYQSKLDQEGAWSWARHHIVAWVARLHLVESGTCSEEEAKAMSDEESWRHYRDFAFESLEQAEKRDRATLDALGGIPMTDETLQKLYRYETTIENRLFKALHELERLQGPRGGQLVPAPLIIESNQQG